MIIISYTVEDVKKHIENNKETIIQALDDYNLPSVLKSLPGMMDVFGAGEWISKTLHVLGATDKEIEEICFAHGQRSFGKDTFEAAVAYVNEYAKTNQVKEKPGMKLATKIHNEMFGLDNEK